MRKWIILNIYAMAADQMWIPLPKESSHLFHKINCHTRLCCDYFLVWYYHAGLTNYVNCSIAISRPGIIVEIPIRFSNIGPCWQRMGGCGAYVRRYCINKQLLWLLAAIKKQCNYYHLALTSLQLLVAVIKESHGFSVWTLLIMT